ncbi:lipopolysaccharide assembly protein LapA domain-containing protein [Ammoniphilus sp. YIM 78166]|uniref:lipopolysaccharide assembly protein LapA domain-containing protein n=1 Tax=Ammoniphilus sp. YIM 78166 TaxID=1644106 RepID=UPI00106F53C1|nr:lipopolysaccharide assembly protein LapA domain-containing protein [Ammoniphilus sp. YIM 78166]
MKVQWSLILGLLFALLVAVFAVANVAPVTVHYLLGLAEIPLIIVILGSALLGGLVVGLLGIFRQYTLQWEISKLKKEIATWKEKDKTSLSITDTGEKMEEGNIGEQHIEKKYVETAPKPNGES